MNTEITGKFLRAQISENITIGVRVAQHSYRSLLAHSPILCLNNDLFFDVFLFAYLLKILTEQRWKSAV